MTGAPYEPGTDPSPGDPQDALAGDLGIGAPADDAGEQGGATQPPGYPEEVDPAQGPLAGAAGASTGDLTDPGPH